MSLNFYKDAATWGADKAKDLMHMPVDWMKRLVMNGINTIGRSTRSAVGSLLKGVVNVAASIPIIPGPK